MERNDHTSGKFKTNRYSREEDLTLKKVIEIVEKKLLDPESTTVLTAGEPTIVKELPDIAFYLKKHGFKEIALQTNGRLLSYMDYCLKLVRSGITQFTVSVHGSNYRFHEALTRTRGSFEQTMQGLENLLKIKTVMPSLKIMTSTILTKINISDLENLLKFLVKKHSGIKTVVLNPLTLKGNALNYADRLAISYTDISDTLSAAVKNLSIESADISVTDMPPCINSAYAGFFEDINLLNLVMQKKDIPEKMGMTGLKNKNCKGCRYSNCCSGIYPEYIKLFGWDEFKAVK